MMYMAPVNTESTPHTAALQNKESSLSLSLPLTSVLLLHVHHEQGQVVVIGRQQGFDPALLTGLVVSGKLVRAQSWLTPHQREGKLLLGFTQLDGAALQNNHACEVAVCRPVLVEEKVALEHEPALLIGGLYLALWDIDAIYGLLTFYTIHLVK